MFECLCSLAAKIKEGTVADSSSEEEVEEIVEEEVEVKQEVKTKLPPVAAPRVQVVLPMIQPPMVAPPVMVREALENVSMCV